MNIISKLVPNYQVGRNGNTPKAIVIHSGVGTHKAINSTFMNELRSSHYCVDNNGIIWQFVLEENTAWHSGTIVRPTAPILKQYPFLNPNVYTIGIENANDGIHDIDDQQYALNTELVADICQRYEIPCDSIHVINHREINSSKNCPGKISTARIIKEANAIMQKVAQLEEVKISLMQRIIALYKQILAKLLE